MFALVERNDIPNMEKYNLRYIGMFGFSYYFALNTDCLSLTVRSIAINNKCCVEFLTNDSGDRRVINVKILGTQDDIEVTKLTS